MSRSLVNRKALYRHDRESFHYPLGLIGKNEYTLEKIVCPLVKQSHEEAIASAGDFPNNIDTWIWSNAGHHHDDMPWALFCRLTNGAYAFYEAGYECSGFTIVGDMKLVISNDFADIVDYGMGNFVYATYEEETEPV